MEDVAKGESQGEDDTFTKDLVIILSVQNIMMYKTRFSNAYNYYSNTLKSAHNHNALEESLCYLLTKLYCLNFQDTNHWKIY